MVQSSEYLDAALSSYQSALSGVLGQRAAWASHPSAGEAAGRRLATLLDTMSNLIKTHSASPVDAKLNAPRYLAALPPVIEVGSLVEWV
jgi:hypothetical protein